MSWERDIPLKPEIPQRDNLPLHSTLIGRVCHPVAAHPTVLDLRYDATMPLPIDKLKRLTELDPTDSTLFFALGQAHLDAGQFADAVTALERAITLNPHYTAAYWPLGKALEGAGRLADAMTVYERGLRIAETTRDMIPMQKMRARLNRLKKRQSSEESSPT